MIEKEVLERLVKVGSFADWFGLVSGYSLRKVANKACLWGLTGRELWSKEALETVIAPYRKYANQQKLNVATIDSDLQFFAGKTDVDISEVRRVYHQINAKPEEKSEKLTEEAESDFEDFETPEEFEEEGEKE